MSATLTCQDSGTSSKVKAMRMVQIFKYLHTHTHTQSFQLHIHMNSLCWCASLLSIYKVWWFYQGNENTDAFLKDFMLFCLLQIFYNQLKSIYKQKKLYIHLHFFKNVSKSPANKNYIKLFYFWSHLFPKGSAIMYLSSAFILKPCRKPLYWMDPNSYVTSSSVYVAHENRGESVCIMEVKTLDSGSGC